MVIMVMGMLFWLAPWCWRIRKLKLQSPTQEHTCCPAFDQFVRNLNKCNLQNPVASQSGASLQKVPSDTAGAWQHVVLQLISFSAEASCKANFKVLCRKLCMTQQECTCCPAVWSFFERFGQFYRTQLQGHFKLNLCRKFRPKQYKCACCPSFWSVFAEFEHFCRNQLQGSFKLLCRKLKAGVFKGELPRGVHLCNDYVNFNLFVVSEILIPSFCLQ